MNHPLITAEFLATGILKDRIAASQIKEFILPSELLDILGLVDERSAERIEDLETELRDAIGNAENCKLITELESRGYTVE